MRKIRALGRQIDRDKRNNAQPTVASYEDIVKHQDGLSYSRTYTAEDELVAAGKRAAEMPDIAKTLEGRK